MDPIETWHDAPTFEVMEEKIRVLEAKLYRLAVAAKEVVRISDRKHDAWDNLKEAIRAARVKP